MKDIQYVMATIMEDALMRGEFPKEYKKLEQLKRRYQAMRVGLYKKTMKKIRRGAK